MFTLRACLRACFREQLSYQSIARRGVLFRSLSSEGVVSSAEPVDVGGSGDLEPINNNTWKEVDADLPRHNALDLVSEENVSVVAHIRPSLKRSFNLAAYVNVSETLQQLLKLQVDLSKLDRHHQLASHVVRADFEADIQPYILWLVREGGVAVADLGAVLNRNPFILMTPIEDLQVRLNYLLFRRFTKAEVASILVRGGELFRLDTRTLDARLGFLLQQYALSAGQLRAVVNWCPRLLTLTPMQVKKVTFSLEEECGFSKAEIRSILLAYPRLWRRYYGSPRTPPGRDLVRTFDYLHGEMGLAQEVIAKTPKIFSVRLPRIEYRHRYLVALGRAQYDPTRPLYVPLTAFYELDDAEFCLRHAKTSVHDLNAFLKTM